MWSYGFHDSVDGDRKYNAQQISAMFEGIISDGVFANVGNGLRVKSSLGMTVSIDTGRGWFNNKWVKNDSSYNFQIEEADVTLNRYCAVCIKADNSLSSRSVKPYLKYSDFAVNPTKPTMERTDQVKEYCLAYIYIKKGAKAIAQADIEDTRMDDTLCGFVTNLVDNVSLNTLYSQFEAQFINWFTNLRDILDENPTTSIVERLPNSFKTTIRATQGGGGGMLLVPDLREDTIVFVIPENPIAYDGAEITITNVTDGSISYEIKNDLEEDTDVTIIYMG